MTERDELLNLIKCAIEFCNLAAEEGIYIDNLSPEDFLFDYSGATGYEDWCTISDYVIDQIKRDDREIERLREALTRIAEYRSQAVAYDDDMGHTRRDFDIGAVIRMESIARAALQQEGGT